MRIIIDGTAKEIAALAYNVQELQSQDKKLDLPKILSAVEDAQRRYGNRVVSLDKDFLKNPVD